jgi:F-type H+-transporting ATPase subunit b
MFLQLDGTFWIQLINFVIFFALLNVLFLRPVSRAIRQRREYINGVVTDYDKYQAEANALREQAESIRANARRDAEAALAKARADASNSAADISAQYATKAQSTIEDAQQKARGELEAARANESQLVQQLADLMVERTVSEVAQ